MQILFLGVVASCAWLIYALLTGRILVQWRWYYRDRSPKFFWFMQFATFCGLLFCIYKLIEITGPR